MSTFRRTKILTTLGPSTDTPEVLEQLIQAGANVVRLNFSHGSAQDHIARAEMVRAAAKKLNTYVGILGDLQGPKIRVARFKEAKIQLAIGDVFTLDAALDKDSGDQNQVGLDYSELPNDVEPGDMLLLDDGRVQLRVTSIDGSKVITEVVIGGPLSNNKGINKQGGGLTADALTDKDKEDIITAAEIGVEYLAVSFPRNGDEMRYARNLAEKAGLKTKLVAKVERAEVVATDEALDDVILASDAVMVARGDLGVEIGDAELVAVQKNIIGRTRTLNRVVITATQMMESMITSPMPTRAEVMDVANAVLDGTDAVMLSAETAAGDYPIETVQAMANVCLGAESHPSIVKSRHRMQEEFNSVEETIALSTMYAANHMTGIKAIVALSESGATPQLMSRISSHLPIYCLSRHHATLAAAALYRGVYSVKFDSTQVDSDSLTMSALAELKIQGHVSEGDLVLFTCGDRMETVGGTNTCKILKVK
ncbi:pyruvate kinase [Psychrobium sp. 1_MG-2023]|uniref:pyruvate kinase n=1 Tax=Psychrobium sp. 1_MG-2023 TaxID=3062624 RepID=UPI000C324D42|nr:pyruvate kinase [Psychrobium sp. 1_MG-2023]MDP2560307.1 pyruvate kinase [Psychrobium sp. 1_MG-2023]PKF55423.1 pyruvate kinase [Alteromonadales bacterium alter-6D02]